MRPKILSLLFLLPLLSACVDDRIAYEAGNGQIFTLIREQPLFWKKEVNLYLVVSRLPDCMRRHTLGQTGTDTRFELWQYRPDTFILKFDNRMVATETRTCEGLEQLQAPPADGLGTLLGTYGQGAEKFGFIPASPVSR